MNTDTTTMRLALFLIFLLFQANVINGQTSLNEIDLNNGNYKVGFLHYTTSDSTRTYSRIYDYSNKVIVRQIPVSIWYPSEQEIGNISPLRILDYFEILKEEEEWEHLPNEQILNWFYYATRPKIKNILEKRQQHTLRPNSQRANIL